MGERVNGTLPSHECKQLDKADFLDGHGQFEDRSANIPQDLP